VADIKTFVKFFNKWRNEEFFAPRDWSHLSLINGWTDPRALTMLNIAVSEFMEDNEQYLEIGTYCGKSVCAALWANDKRAQVIDAFSLVMPDGDAIEDAWRRNVSEQGVAGRTTLHKTFSQSFKRELPPIGVYYYDGSHEWGMTYRGLVDFEQFLADRAIIIVDDVAMPEVGPDIPRYVAEREDRVKLLGITPFSPHNQAVMIFER
jgi:predicted O-methyltransferase YrrM